MALNKDDQLLYYERELTYLRKMGQAFSEMYPKIAGRLELSAEQSRDPYVERLIESFAFLTGRVQHTIESEFPEVSAALLNLLYPHFLDPVPSFSIAQFLPDPEQGKLTTGHLIEKNTSLFATTQEGEVCKFSTCYPLTLWPVKVSFAGFESTDQYDFLDTSANVATVLRLRIEPQGGEMNEINLKQLRFFLNGESTTIHELYEILFGHLTQTILLPDGEKTKPVFLPKDSILPVGFKPEDDIIPYRSYSHPGYRLIQEYFTFPSKYLFFDVKNLEANESQKYFDILILLNSKPKDRMVIGPDTFALGCTPIVNLFRQTSEPIRIDHRQTEYRLVPDARREHITEVHSIIKVSGSSDASLESEVYMPYFSFNHHMQQEGHSAFWLGRRKFTGRKELPGTEMFLSFLNLNFSPTQPASELVYAHTLCTNRDLALQVPQQALLQIEDAAPLSHITCLKKPTPQLMPELGGNTLWKLISHLSLNHLSLAGGSESLNALREILKLYNLSGRSSSDQQLAGIREMKCRKMVQRIGREAWRGFCHGTEVTLVFDEKMYVGNSAFLLASVLNRFLPIYASINSFTRLVIKSLQRDGIWKQWAPTVGEKNIL